MSGHRRGLVNAGVLNTESTLCRGTLRGAGRVGEFAVDGRFDFDLRLFDAEFHLPAEAGVAASIDAGLTLGTAIINATGGINASASASLVASATPHVDLDWRAATGLALHATLDASLAPRLAFDVNGFAEVTANAFVTTFSLWRKDWNLAHREIGSSLALRLHAPVDYFSDGRGVVFDSARVQFDVPTLNADTLGQLFNEEGGSERVDREPPRPGGTVPRH